MAASSQVEIEVKLPVADAADARRVIQAAGFVDRTGRLLETNTVWDTPEKAVKARGELIRVRCVNNQHILTFKGPSQAGRHRTREELECTVSSPAAVERIFASLGLEQVFRYEKYRTEFDRSGEPGLVLLDETPIGNFIELEGAGSWIDATATALGFTEANYVTSSYGTLYQTWCQARGLAATHMLFERPYASGENGIP